MSRWRKTVLTKFADTSRPADANELTACEISTPRIGGTWSIPIGLSLSFLSAALAVVGNPPMGVWPLVFIAFVPMIVAQHRILPRGLSGLAPGIAIAGVFAGQMSGGLADGGVAWYIQLWPLYVALLIALLAGRGRGFHERTNYRWFLISFPASWVAVEYMRELSGVDVLAATWGNPIYVLFEQYWFLQPISIFGFFGLMLLVLFVNFAVGRAAIVTVDRYIFQRPVPWKAAIAPLGLAAAAITAWTATSLLLLDDPDPSLRVAAIQPNAPLDADEEFARNLQLSREAAAKGAQLIVWREGSMKFDPFKENRELLETLAKETGAYYAMGYRLTDERGRLNEAVFVSKDGEFLGTYGKAHPGTFAGDYSDRAGDSYPIYETDLGRISTIICYDLDFLDTARKMARGGAQIVAVPSADVPSIAHLHYSHLVFRAIENRLTMAKADNLFDSAIIDPYGRIVERNLRPLSFAEAEAVSADNSLPPDLVIADVPIGSGRSVTATLGEWVGLSCLAIAFLFLVWPVARFLKGAGTP